MVKKLRYPMIFLLIGLFSFVLSSCANPVDQFMEKVDSSDYQEARDIYNEEIYGNLEDEKTVYNELLTRLENAIADYNVGTINDVEARNIISTVDRLGIINIFELENFTVQLDSLIESKAAFASAEALYEQSHWLDAYSSYMKVSTEDTNYDAAQEKAISAQNLFVDYVLALVKSSVSNHEYYSALRDLTVAIDLFSSNEQLLSQRDIVKHEYEEYALTSAENVFSESYDYQAAYNIVAPLQDEFLDFSLEPSDELKESVSYYNSFYPVELLNLDYYTRSGLEPAEWTSTDKDNLGNTYTYGWKFSWWTKEESEQSYLLSGNYDRLTGTFVCHYDSRNVRSQSENIDMFHSELDIYGDGRLLYSSPNMGYRVNPVSFDIDIRGIQELTIQIDFYSSSMAGMKNGLVDVYIQKFPG